MNTYLQEYHKTSTQTLDYTCILHILPCYEVAHVSNRKQTVS